MASEKRVRLDLMCRPELKSTLRMLADAEGVSMSQYVERVIAKMMDSAESTANRERCDRDEEMASIRHQLDSITAFLVAEHDYQPF